MNDIYTFYANLDITGVSPSSMEIFENYDTKILVTGTNFIASSSLVCVFISASGVRITKKANFISSTSAECFLSADVYQNSQVDLHMSLNGGDSLEDSYGVTTRTYTILSEPQFISAAISGGVSDSDTFAVIMKRGEIKTITLTGINFSNIQSYTPLCLFGANHLFTTAATYVSDTELTCSTPDITSSLEESSLDVSLYVEDLGLIYGS